MNILFTARRAAMFLLLALPSFSWAYGLPPRTALIVNDPTVFTADEAAVVSFLSSRLTAASITVTTNAGVPAGSLSGYTQIWDVRAATAMTPSDITAYVTYLSGGGALFAMGENQGCCAVRDTSVIALITAAGGGTVTISGNSANTQTAQAPFTGPVALTTLTYAAVGGFTAIGRGAFVTEDSPTTGGAVVFGPGTLTNATSGTLISVLDINFMDTNGASLGLSQALTDNLIAYLAAPTVIPNGLPPTPAPSTLILVSLGLAGAGLLAVRQRRLA